MGTSDAKVSFGIDVLDETASGVKGSVANLQQLRGAMDADTLAISNITKALKNMQGGNSVSINQFKMLKQQLADHKVSLASSSSKYVELGGHLKKLPMGETKTGLDGIKEALTSSGGPLGAMASGASGLITKLGSLGVAGMAILATVAIIALGVAIAAAAIQIGKFALIQADAYRTDLLTMEAWTKIPNFWGIAAGKADQLMASTNRVSAMYGIARSQAMGFTKELYTQGYRGAALQRALEATSIATAAFGGDTAMASKYMGAMSWQFGLLGKGSAAFAARVKHDLGDLAVRQALSFGKQMTMLKQNIGLLFSGIKIEGLLKGLNTVLSLFSETTVTGQALKYLLSEFFSPFSRGAEGAAASIKHFIIQGIIQIVRLQTAWIKFQIWFAETTGYKGDLGVTIAITALGAVMAGILTVGIALAAILVNIGIAALVALSPFLLIGAAVTALLASMVFLGYQIYKAWQEISLYDIGHYLIGGLVDGIKGALGSLWNLLASIATGVVSKLKALLGIHSPSLLFKTQIGYQLPMGMAAGIRAGAPAIHSAVREMIAIPATEPAVRASSVGGGASRAGAVPSISLTFNVDGSKSPMETATAIERVVEALLQRSLAMAGGT